MGPKASRAQQAQRDWLIHAWEGWSVDPNLWNDLCEAHENAASEIIELSKQARIDVALTSDERRRRIASFAPLLREALSKIETFRRVLVSENPNG
jgi:hypothetical protein